MRRHPARPSNVPSTASQAVLSTESASRGSRLMASAVAGICLAAVVAFVLSTIFLFLICKRYRARHALAAFISPDDKHRPKRERHSGRSLPRARSPVDGEYDDEHMREYPYRDILAEIASTTPRPNTARSSSAPSESGSATDLAQHTTYTSSFYGHTPPSRSASASRGSHIHHTTSSSNLHTVGDHIDFLYIPQTPLPLDVPPSSYPRQFSFHENVEQRRRWSAERYQPPSLERRGSAPYSLPTSLLNPPPPTVNLIDLQPLSWAQIRHPPVLPPLPVAISTPIDMDTDPAVFQGPLLHFPNMPSAGVSAENNNNSLHSLHDNVDYSRPIMAQLGQSSSTLDIDDRH